MQKRGTKKDQIIVLIEGLIQSNNSINNSINQRTNTNMKKPLKQYKNEQLTTSNIYKTIKIIYLDNFLSSILTSAFLNIY